MIDKNRKLMKNNMTLDEVIAVLQNYKKRFGGNIKVVVSSDSEGNSFGTLGDWSFCPVCEDEDELIRVALENGYKQLDKLLKPQKEIGICIFPHEEGYETAEKAVKQERL